MPLVPALLSCYATSIISGTILFIRARSLKQDVTWLFWSCHVAGTSASITWHWQYCQWHHLLVNLRWLKRDQTWHFLVMWCLHWHHMTTMAATVAAIAFVTSIWRKWETTWLFSHLTLLALASSCDANAIIKSTNASIRSRWWKVQHDIFCYVVVLVLAPVSYDANSVINDTTAFNRSKWSKWDEHDFLVMWYHLHWHWYHVLLVALSSAQ